MKKIFVLILTIFSLHAAIIDEIKSQKKWLIAKIKMNSICLGEEDKIPHLDISWVSKAFIDSFSNELFSHASKNDKNKKLSNLSPWAKAPSYTIGIPEEYTVKYAQLELPSFYKIHSYHPDEMFFPSHLEIEKIKNKKKILNHLSGKYYLQLELKTSLWAQEITGFILVFSAEGLQFKKYIKVNSPYIILDKKSPYLTKYDKIFGMQAQTGKYKDEILYIYRDLGKKLAEQVLIFIGDGPIPQKKKLKFTYKQRAL